MSFELAFGYDDSTGRSFTTSARMVNGDSAIHIAAPIIPAGWQVTYSDDSLVVAMDRLGINWVQVSKNDTLTDDPLRFESYSA